MIITRLQVEHLAQEVRDRGISDRLRELLSADDSPCFNLTLEGMPDGE